jgi:hypothetical protein
MCSEHACTVAHTSISEKYDPLILGMPFRHFERRHRPDQFQFERCGGRRCGENGGVSRDEIVFVTALARSAVEQTVRGLTACADLGRMYIKRAHDALLMQRQHLSIDGIRIALDNMFERDIDPAPLVLFPLLLRVPRAPDGLDDHVL